MSLCHPRCKAFLRWVEQALWVLIAIVIFGLWCFYLYQWVAS